MATTKSQSVDVEKDMHNALSKVISYKKRPIQLKLSESCKLFTIVFLNPTKQIG